MKILTLLLLTSLTSVCYGQTNLPMQESGRWMNNRDGYTCLALPVKNDTLSLPAEFTGLYSFTIFHVPFLIDDAKPGQFGTSLTGKEHLEMDLPEDTREILFVLFADFPDSEHGNPAPLNVLNEPERAVIELVYNDGQRELMLPVNADNKRYGITRGRALYSVSAPTGKTIKKFSFIDKMDNACFQIIAATVNKKMIPRIAAPIQNAGWYKPGNKVRLQDSRIELNSSDGLSWKGIYSGMLPEDIQLKNQPVFVFASGSKHIPSSEWVVTDVKKNNTETVYTVTYNEDGLNLKARLTAGQTNRSEVEFKLQLWNESDQKVKGQLFFPVLSDINIGSSAHDTWYAYSRNGLIVNNIACSYQDYLGGEKPLQFDAIFNPTAGVALGIFPRDTTDFFRWYNFGKNDKGVNYSLEYVPEEKGKGEAWHSVPVAISVIPGDWKDVFSSYQVWLRTWHRKSTPEIDWFKKVFAFTFFDMAPGSNPDFLAAARADKERFGYLDYFHIFGWSDTKEFGFWGDYNHFESVGGKKKFASDIKNMQTKVGTRVGLYLDGYLVSIYSRTPSDEKKTEWAIKTESGNVSFAYDEPYEDDISRTYKAYVECLYVKPFRDFLVDRFREVKQVTGADGLYCDEVGMSLRSRVCFDKTHGHDVPMYMAAGENKLMKELKAAFPETPIYNEFGGTDVGTQYTDGSVSFLTTRNSFSIQDYNFPGNVSYDDIAPHYLDIRKFAIPYFKSFDWILAKTPWRNGNWSLGKFPFFNGNCYFHNANDGIGGDPEAIAMFRKIRALQDRYKNEFSSDDTEPFVSTLYPNTFANRFSTAARDVYTIFNANFREVNDAVLKVKYHDGATYRDVWNDRNVEIVEIKDGIATLRFLMDLRSVVCIVGEVSN